MKLKDKHPHELDKHVAEHPDYADNHIYLINGESHLDLGYKSVTSFLSELFEKFDADKIIDKYYDKWQKNEESKYHGMDKAEIKQQWQEKGQLASDEGTLMHLMFENYVNEAEYENIPEMENFLNWIRDNNILPYRSEMTIFDPEWKLVGNVDLLALDENGNMIIVDYKRADKPHENDYGKKIKKLGFPDTNATKHILQLNIYRHIFEKNYGFKIKGLYNLYIKEDKCEYVEQPFVNLNSLLEEISNKFNNCDNDCGNSSGNS